jgi:uncharacterized membrane protein YgcG
VKIITKRVLKPTNMHGLIKQLFHATPFQLFVLLLLVLVASIYVTNNYKGVFAEGYIGYNYDKVPLTMNTVPAYDASRQLLKIYDNLYFDKQNANLIEVSGNMYTGNTSASPMDTVSSVAVYTPRKASNSINLPALPTLEQSSAVVHGPYAPNANIPENRVTAVDASYRGLSVVYTLDRASALLYVADGANTAVHVIDFSNSMARPINALTVGVLADNVVSRKYGLAEGQMVVDPTGTRNAVDLIDFTVADVVGTLQGTRTTIPGYDQSKTPMYITNKFAIDENNGNLIYCDSSSSCYVYPWQMVSSGGAYNDIQPTRYTAASPCGLQSAFIVESSFYPYWFVTADKKFYVFMVQNGISSYGAIFVKHPRNSTLLSLAGVALVPRTTIETTVSTSGSSSSSSSSSGSSSGSSGSSSGSSSSGTSPNIGPLIANILQNLNMEDVRHFAALFRGMMQQGSAGTGASSSSTDANNYINEYQWFNYWNAVKDSKDPQSLYAANNYLPKTAIIPPVCPSCPASGSGVCNSCGGNGGAGTSGTKRNRFIDYVADFGSGTKDLAIQTGKGTKDLAIQTGKGVKDFIEDTGSGAADFARDATKGTVGLGREVTQGTVGLAKEIVGGTVGLAKDTIGGTVGLAKDVVGGTWGAARDIFGGLNPTQIGSPVYGNYMGGGAGSQQQLQRGIVPVGMDPYSYSGNVPNRGSSNYIPVTADFSAFSR